MVDLPANLSRADLEFANLRGALLTGVNLRGATLGGADLTGAHVEGADFAGADVTSTRLVNLQGEDKAKGIEQTENLARALRQ